MTVPVVSRTTTSTSDAEPDLQRQQLRGVDAGQPGGAEQLLPAADPAAAVVRGCGARGPLRQMSSSPTPSSSPRRAPVTRTCPSPSSAAQVEAERREPLGVRRIAVGAHEPALAAW